MPGDVAVEFAAEAPAEPYYGVVSEALAFPSFRANIPDLTHPFGVKELTSVTIAVTGELSAIAQLLTREGIATLELGPGPLVTLTFDGGALGRVVDVRPALPLILKG
jgi:hypothetical protein